MRRTSSAIVALRFGRNPYEHGKKPASHIGSIFCALAARLGNTSFDTT